ncbi:hypothetical protein O181_079605 [Austropuccinia psidii MF-1]|uniref:Uncharacterized protein n=1 Tax=Austropuccinia psidii MF-1 TaxID=1389203 RepID=A0A9Q3II34_9BASI|nr:hypothetical protein [Austropuccinia psidii MF-1]
MQDSRASTSSQRFSRTFYTIFYSPESDITAIPVFRSEKLPTSSSRDRPTSVQELVYGSKAARVGSSSKPLNKDNELIYSNEEALEPRKDPIASEGMNTHVLEGTGPKDQSLVKKQKHFVRGSEERVGPKEGKQTFGSSSGLPKQE